MWASPAASRALKADLTLTLTCSPGSAPLPTPLLQRTLNFEKSEICPSPTVWDPSLLEGLPVWHSPSLWFFAGFGG